MQHNRRVDPWRVAGLFAGLVVWGLFAPAVALGVAACYLVLSLLVGVVTRRRAEGTRHGLAAAAVSVALTLVEWVIT